MKIIKRNGAEVEFDIEKIIGAIEAANNEVVESDRLTEEQIKVIAHTVEYICSKRTRALGVEEIQDLVENELMKFGV